MLTKRLKFPFSALYWNYSLSTINFPHIKNHLIMEAKLNEEPYKEEVKEEQKEEVEINKPAIKENTGNQLKKILLPKKKYAVIHGYNGHSFFGNQR